MLLPRNLFLLRAAVAILVAMSLIRGESRAANQWVSIGPYGGDRFELKISPLDRQILFVYGFRGIHKSTDSGATWGAVYTSDMMRGNSVTCLVFNPQNFQNIFIGGTSRGVWRSFNGGDTWEPCSNGLSQEAPGVYAPVSALENDSQGNLYAGISDPGIEMDPAPAWIYSSGDGGNNWTPSDNGIVIASTTLYQPVSVLLSRDAAGELWAMVYGGGVFRREMGTWVAHNGDLPQSALRATFLACHPTDAAHFFLGTEDSWVYETTDAGATWIRMSLPQELSSLSVLPLAYFIGVDPNNLSLINIKANDSVGSIEQPFFRPRPEQNAGVGLYTSVNGGSQWFRQSIHLFRKVFDASEAITNNIPGLGTVTRSKISYTTSGGNECVNKSDDGQVTYAPTINGISSILMNAIWAHPNPPAPYSSIIYAGAEAGIFVSAGGTNPVWKRQKAASDILYTWSFAQDFSNSNQVFYSTGNPAWNYLSQRGIYLANVDCLTDPSDECPPGQQLLSNVGIWKVVTTSANPSKIYAASQEQGILVSSNNGQTWDFLNAGLTLPVSITDIILDATGAPLYAASRTSNGETSYDHQKSWVPTSDEVGAVYAFNEQQQEWMRLNGVNAGVLALDFDAQSNVLYAATVQGIFRSADNGTTWQQYYQGTIFTDILIDPAQRSVVLAATYAGLYRSLDGGLTWRLKDDCLRKLEINQIAIDSVSGILYAATNGESVYRLSSDPQTIYVPDNYAGIQEAIDGACDGDTIIVRDGTYTGAGNKNLDFRGKAITLRSEHGPANCIIDCENDGRGFYFHSGETSASVIEGFTIMHGHTSGVGGGINCESSSPTIANCVIRDNSADNGGGIRCNASSPAITKCTISGNSATAYGGGIASNSSSPVITACVISGNSADYGGAISCSGPSTPIITNCSVVGNSADFGGGISCSDTSLQITNCTISGNVANTLGGGISSGVSSTSTLVNCILWDNSAPQGHELSLRTAAYPSSVTIDYSDVMNGQTDIYRESGCTLNWGSGNIDSAPLFVQSGQWNGGSWVDGDYHLALGSPCVDVGTATGAPANDIDDNLRPLGNGFDMGSDEYVPTSCVGQKGDINSDGNTNAGDAVLSLKIAAGLQIGNPPHPPGASERCRDDVNCDSLNNSGDALLILQKAVGLLTQFPCGD
jgi:photosystem II stability/assembly factor-like uncharacterized protein